VYIPNDLMTPLDGDWCWSYVGSPGPRKPLWLTFLLDRFFIFLLVEKKAIELGMDSLAIK